MKGNTFKFHLQTLKNTQRTLSVLYHAISRTTYNLPLVKEDPSTHIHTHTHIYIYIFENPFSFFLFDFCYQLGLGQDNKKIKVKKERKKGQYKSKKPKQNYCFPSNPIRFISGLIQSKSAKPSP